MAALLACRICLSQENRLCSISNTPLQEFYERVTNEPLYAEDMRPTTVCYICYHQLIKNHRFIWKAQQANELFSELFNDNTMMTEKVLDENQREFAWNYSVSTSRVAIGGYVEIEVENPDLKVDFIDIELDQETDLPTDAAAAPDEMKVNTPSGSDDDDVPLLVRKGNLREKKKNEENSELINAKVTENTYDTQSKENASEPTKLVSDNQDLISKIKKINTITLKHIPAKTTSDVENGAKLNDSEKPVTVSQLKIMSRYACLECNRNFSSDFTLQKHMAIHDLLTANEKMAIAKGNVNKPNMPFVCNFCQAGFYFKHKLTKHLKKHVNEKSYECSYCHKFFYQKSDYTRHSRIHTGEKPYQCNFCDKSFSDHGNLIPHLRTHTGEKPYECKTCHKCFYLKSVLTRHLRIHTGERPYVCQFCDKRFSIQSNLTTHIRIHTGERPYVCKLCDKGFYRSSELAKHSVIHTAE